MNFYPQHFNEIGYFSMKNQFHGKFNWLEYICLLSHQYFEDTSNSQFHTSTATQRAQPWNTPMVAQHWPLERSQSQHRTSQPLRQRPAVVSRLGRWDLATRCSKDPARPFCTTLLQCTASLVPVLSTWMQTNLYSHSLPTSLLCFTLKADLKRMTKKSYRLPRFTLLCSAASQSCNKGAAGWWHSPRVPFCPDHRWIPWW